MARVLLFAGDADFAEMLQSCIETGGHQVRIEDDWRRAKELCDAGQLDVLVIDIAPPERIGLVLVLELKDRWEGSRVIATAWREDILRAERAGAGHVLRKPFGCDEILAALRSTASV